MRQPKSKLLDSSGLLNYALRVLSARPLSSAEMEARLKARAENPTDIEGVMVKLKDAGFLNDAKFAEYYAAARRDNQGFGKMRVLRDLRTRKVSGKLAGEVVQNAFEEVDETAMVEQYLARKYRSVELGAFLGEPKNLAAAYRRLRVAGFSSTVSIRVLKRYAARADELSDVDEGDVPGDSGE